MGKFVIQKRKPGRKWTTIASGLDRADAAAQIKVLRDGQAGVSEWDAIAYRIGMDR